MRSEVALLNNRDLQATYEELGIAQAELVEAGLLTNPRLLAEVRSPKYHALPFELDVTQSFIELLTLPLRSQAGAAFEAAKLRVTHEVLNTAAEAEASFYPRRGPRSPRRCAAPSSRQPRHPTTPPNGCTRPATSPT